MTFEHIALLVEKYVAKKRPFKEDKNEQQCCELVGNRA